MRPDVVVPVAESNQINIELFDARDDPLVKLVFEGAEQPFDPAVLPGAAGVGALVADAEFFQGKTEGHRPEHAFVVGADDPGFAVNANGLAQAVEDGGGGLVVQHLQVEERPAAVVEDAEQQMKNNGNPPLHRDYLPESCTAIPSPRPARDGINGRYCITGRRQAPRCGY